MGGWLVDKHNICLRLVCQQSCTSWTGRRRTFSCLLQIYLSVSHKRRRQVFFFKLTAAARFNHLATNEWQISCGNKAKNNCTWKSRRRSSGANGKIDRATSVVLHGKFCCEIAKENKLFLFSPLFRKCNLNLDSSAARLYPFHYLSFNGICLH